VRPDWAGKGDQKRVMTPGEAVREGADYLVIGRPVTKAEEPEKAVIKILEEMKGAL
jgi:orotidine-5'-phosphate decarboxylase